MLGGAVRLCKCQRRKVGMHHVGKCKCISRCHGRRINESCGRGESSPQCGMQLQQGANIRPEHHDDEIMMVSAPDDGPLGT